MKIFPRASDTADNSNKDNSEYSIQLNRWFLKPVGAWPAAVKAKGELNLSRPLIFVCYSLMSMTLVPCFLNMMYEEENKQMRLQAIGPMGLWLMGVMYYSSLLLHGNDILDCIEHIVTDWKIVTGLEDRETMIKHAGIGRFMAGFCAMFMHGSTLVYSIVKGVEMGTTVIGNETVLVRLLPFPFYNKIWDTRFSPAYEVIFGMQVISCFVVNCAAVGACSLASVFAMHACGQLNVLVSRLNHLVGDEGEDFCFSERRLAGIVEHHVRVMRFVGRIETVLNQVCLVEVLGCTFHMCLLGYFIITGWDNIGKRDLSKFVVLYMSMSFNIFIFCYIGEILAEKCERISEVAYMTEWYRLPHKIALGLTLIICRSNVIPRITAGKIIQLSVVTFGDAVRTSLVYINILRTMMTAGTSA